jgi:hypothetical protein
MKTILLIIAVAFIGCEGANDKTKCLESVKVAFPNSKIYTNGAYTFMVIDSVNVFEVNTLNLTDANISNISAYKKVN